MILDFRTGRRGALEAEYQNGRTTLDGVEVRLVFYVNTGAGLLKTYDLSQHPEAAPGTPDKPFAACSWFTVFPKGIPDDVSGFNHEPLVWTRRGKVEVFKPCN